ncbi:hypothetical protein A3Q23_06365 [Lactobacillus johnsonii]|nr:hypothetical protein A3Q23_06365 [Lactobacillus johnsonii]
MTDSNSSISKLYKQRVQFKRGKSHNHGGHLYIKKVFLKELKIVKVLFTGKEILLKELYAIISLY